MAGNGSSGNISFGNKEIQWGQNQMMFACTCIKKNCSSVIDDLFK